jgi:ribosome-binding protein aMBF1 (putative translation factor)
MAKKFSHLVSKMSPERRARPRARAQEILAEMALQELRRARELSQAQLAEALGEKQPNISQLEQRTDMYVSTLRRYIVAMGGELEIIARFPEGAVRIKQFTEV